MPAACRIGDLSTSHGCFPPRICDTGSPDTFVNSIAQHRQGDHWIEHCCPNNGCHDSVLANGSPTEFVNGYERGRVGDPIACGSLVATGSPDTDIGPVPGSGPGSPGWEPDLFYFEYFRAGRSRSGDRLLEIMGGA